MDCLPKRQSPLFIFAKRPPKFYPDIEQPCSLQDSGSPSKHQMVNWILVFHYPLHLWFVQVNELEAKSCLGAFGKGFLDLQKGNKERSTLFPPLSLWTLL